MSRQLTLAALMLSVLVSSCGDSSTGPAPVATVVVSPATAEVRTGESVQLSATARNAADQVLPGRAITWDSDDPGVAEVSNSGRVTAVAAGEARITATAEGQTGRATITVMVQPVAQISIEPSTRTLSPGETVQLTARLSDSSGRTLTDREVTWASSDESVVTVDQEGTVTAVAIGNAQISATSEGRSAEAAISVREPSEISIDAVAPDTLRDGETATLTGTGFDPIAENNLVLIDGAAAQVVSASETQLQFRLAEGQCLPLRNARIVVSVGSDTSPAVQHPARPASFLSMQLGEQQVLGSGERHCLQFAHTAGDEMYLVGLQSTSEVAAAATDATVTAKRGLGSGAQSAQMLRSAAAASGAGRSIPAAMQRRIERLAKHRTAEARLRRMEREQLDQATMPLARTGAQPSLSMVAAGVPVVGDTVKVRVPDITANLCVDYSEIDGIVRAVGDHGVWLDDADNPEGGFTTADYEGFSGQFDDVIYQATTEYFGEPTDVDGNDRILILTTKQVNVARSDGAAGVLGFVTNADFFDAVSCPSSQGGEIYYGIAPDPQNEFGGGEVTAEEARRDAIPLIAHEFTHIVQYGRRLFSGQSNSRTMSDWQMEGQATLAEEIVGHAMSGRSERQNYGLDVMFEEGGGEDWYLSMFVDMFIYHGYNGSQTEKAPNAPEQCTWLVRDDPEAPCLAQREIYGVPALLLRYLSDRFGPGFPGGAKALQKALIDENPSATGFRNIELLIGQPMSEVLPGWAATLYVDDRIRNADAALDFPSWDLRSINEGVIDPAQLQPRERAFTDFSDNVKVRSGSTAYFLISGAGRASTSLQALDDDGIPLPNSMKLWIVRMK